MLSFIPWVNYVKIFGYEVHIILIFLALSIVFGIFFLTLETRRMSLNIKTVLFIYLLNFALGNLISRAIFVFSRIFIHHDFALQSKVLAFYPIQKVAFGKYLGVLLAVFLGVYFMGKMKNIFKYYDAFFLSLTAIAFVRFADALTRYHPGKIASPFWGVYYLGNYRHLPSLYEAVSVFLLIAVILFIRKKIIKSGFLTLIIVAWTSLSRFITDFFRNKDLPVDNRLFENAFVSSNYHVNGWLTLNQIIYLILFLVSFGVIVYLLCSDKFMIWENKKKNINAKRVDKYTWTRHKIGEKEQLKKAQLLPPKQ